MSSPPWTTRAGASLKPTPTINDDGITRPRALHCVLPRKSRPPEMSDARMNRTPFGGTTVYAHPKYDPTTRELHTMVYAWAEWRDHIQYVVVAADGKVRRTLDIPLPGMSMVHDMSLFTTSRSRYRLSSPSRGCSRFAGIWIMATGSGCCREKARQTTSSGLTCRLAIATTP